MESFSHIKAAGVCRVLLRSGSLASVFFSAADRKPSRKYPPVSGAHSLLYPGTVGGSGGVGGGGVYFFLFTPTAASVTINKS